MIYASTSFAITVGDWSGKINVDSMTDKEIIVMSTYNAVDLLGALLLGDHEIPELIVLFPEGNDVPLIGVSFNKYVGIGGRYSTCLIRLDDNPTEEYQVIIDESNEGIFVSLGTDNETKEFFANMLQSNEFQIRFTPTGRSRETITFSLAGIYSLSSQLGIDVNHYQNLNARILAPTANEILVSGLSVEVEWEGFHGSNVSIDLVSQGRSGNSVHLADCSNTGQTSVIIPAVEGGLSSYSYRIFISNATGARIGSELFRVVPVHILCPRGAVWSRTEGASRSVIWESLGDEALITFCESGDEVIELSDGWIPNSGSFEFGGTLPEDLNSQGRYSIKVQVRDSSGSVRSGSGNVEILASDNEPEGAIRLSEGINAGTLDYPTDVDYWRFVGLPNNRYNFKINGDGDYILRIFSRNGVEVAENSGDDLGWTCSESDQSGQYFLRIEDIYGIASRQYSIDFQEQLAREKHRLYGMFIGLDYLEVDSLSGWGFDCSSFYSPIRYTELGINLHNLFFEELNYVYLSGWLGLRSPRLWRIELLGGVAYDLDISDDEALAYWEEHIAGSREPLLESGLHPFAGLDLLLSGERFGKVTTLRINTFFSDGELGRISAGIGFAGFQE